MKLKSIIIALSMIAGTASAATAENFTQHTMNEIQATIAAKNKAEVCVIDFQGEVGPERLSVGVNKVSNTVVVIGYMLEGNQALSPMFAAMSKQTATEFAKQFRTVAGSDVKELVDDEFFYHSYKSSNGVTVSVDKYATEEIYFGVQDDESLVGGYAVDVKNSRSLVSGCIESAANYL